MGLGLELDGGEQISFTGLMWFALVNNNTERKIEKGKENEEEDE